MHGIKILSTIGIILAATPAWAADESGPDSKLEEAVEAVSTKRFLHGFRMGYLYIANSEKAGPDGSESFADRYNLRSPHQFVLGYELAWRIIGHDWLNILLVTNAMVSGLEQSRVYPSINALVGFEIMETAQIGLGTTVSPTRDKPAHMLMAVGWTPRVGDIHVPLHVFFVPDVDQNHRFGTTVGVNW